MGYRVIDPAEVEPSEAYPCDRRSITEAADLDHLQAAIYELAPGDDLARTYHYHEHREDVFYVLAGELHVETPDRNYVVPTGEVFVAEPGSPIRPHNPGNADEPVRVLGTGAPLYDVAQPYES